MQESNNELDVQLAPKAKRFMKTESARSKRKAVKNTLLAKQNRSVKEYRHYNGVVPKTTVRSMVANTTTHE